MTTSRQFANDEGKFSSEQKAERECPHCHGTDVVYRVWESHDGAYEDYQYTCRTCSKVWWIDGIDS